MEELEKFKAESEILVEMATLDREMAEEHTEYLKSELEALRAKAEELETENEVLKEENRELGGEMSQEEKTSTGWIQMEKQNVRLREALLRLREITQQAEAELKDQVTSLEEDNEQLQKYKEEYEATKEKLAQAEAAVEDLRQQLDTALGAEEMLEELTERNLSMAEHIDELKATIEELESLKELNDELEINHVETEKQMQEELGMTIRIIRIPKQQANSSQTTRTLLSQSKEREWFSLIRVMRKLNTQSRASET